MVFDVIKHRNKNKAWQKKYDALAPKVGDLAPDFELRDANGENPVALASFRGKKPVALIFGSYTWPPYVTGTVGLHDLYLKHHDTVEFMSIYIREAHPIDGWWLGGGGLSDKLTRAVVGSNAATDIYDPKTIDERQAVAGRCERELGYEITTYPDTMDDAVSQAYAAHPTRLYLVGRDGRVVYAGGLGPFGFKPVELGEAIDIYLADGK